MTDPPSSKQSVADFVDLWKESNIPKMMSPDHNAVMSRSSISERYSGKRSIFFTDLSQMSRYDQASVMSEIVSQWPYEMERRALVSPLYAGILANFVTAGIIAVRVSSDVVLFDRKMPLFTAWKQGPKSPVFFGMYLSGVSFFGLHTLTINPALYQEDEPCTSCLLTQSVGISLLTGIILPMLATPYLAYYILLERGNQKYPAVKNMIDVCMLSVEGTRAVRPLLVGLIPLQVTVAAISMYAAFWARDKLFRTLEADPEMAKKLVNEIQSKPSFMQKVQTFLRKIPIITDILGPKSPENERCQ